MSTLTTILIWVDTFAMIAYFTLKTINDRKEKNRKSQD